MKAASSGPSDWPKLPPTWNSDCAKPWRPPEAARATRDASGWKIAEPTPISATDDEQKRVAAAERQQPSARSSVNIIADGSE